MGRLFWKCFLATWITLVLAGALTLTGVHLYRKAASREALLMGGPRAEFELDAAEAVLRHAGPETLAAMLADIDSSMVVMDPAGRDIRGQAPIAGQAILEESSGSAAIHRVPTPLGTYVLFIPGHGAPPPPGSGLLPPPPAPPAPWEPFAFALLASLILSALLAWYLASPVKRLRAAFKAMAGGQLETRVGSLMRRGDEIADLGREFDEMAAKLQSLILAQRRLLHDVSHELRSPLARLQMALGIVRQDPEKLGLTIERMEREVGRLDGLIGEILTLSRINSGVEEELAAVVDLGEMVEGVVHDARFEASGQGREIRLTERDGVRVRGRQALLARAVENVVRNGLRFSPPSGALDVEVGCEGGQAVVRVRDRGPGIPESDLEAVFEPFHRAPGNADPNGSGLGLAIARGAVELHGGSITARNMDDGGLGVEIRLPAIRP